MDIFKLNYNRESSNTDFYDKSISNNNNRLRAKNKKIFHKLARTRLNEDLRKENLNG